MRTLVGVVVLVLSGLTAPAAYAESWSAADRAGDVRVTHVHLEPDPLRCVQPQPQRTRRDGRRDVLGLAVDHGADDVVVTVALREVPRRDPRTVVTFSLRTPQHRYVVSLQPDESGRTARGHARPGPLRRRRPRALPDLDRLGPRQVHCALRGP